MYSRSCKPAARSFSHRFFVLICIANGDVSNAVDYDVKTMHGRRLGRTRRKELNAVLNFVASMVGLVRSVDHGLEKVDIFKVDEVRSTGLGIGGTPPATDESGKITIAHSRAIKTTDTVEERSDSHSMCAAVGAQNCQW